MLRTKMSVWQHLNLCVMFLLCVYLCVRFIVFTSLTLIVLFVFI